MLLFFSKEAVYKDSSANYEETTWSYNATQVE